MWKLPDLETKTTAGAADTDVTVVFQDGGKKVVPPQGHYAQLVERFRKGDAFTARSGSLQYLRFGGKGLAENALFVGMGPAGELTEEKARIAGAHVWTKLCAEKARTAVIHVDSILEARGLKAENAPAGLIRVVRAFAEGLLMSAYKVDKKSANPKANAKKAAGKREDDRPKEYFGPAKLSFVTQDKDFKKLLDTELIQVRSLAESINLARDWSNEPSNFGTPEFYATQAQKIARQLGIKCQVLTEKDATRERMGLFIGVGAGSEREGRIVVLEYTPKKLKGSRARNMKTLALVGKGVTFDSGGISIKPSMRMEDMKHDMTGAATIMGAIVLAAKWQVPNRVVAILAFTENMPDGLAIQPGNVLTSRAGKTVEIINTDAEGRLILADVLDYAHTFKPDAIIDAATLTGAVTVALGKHCCAVLGNDENLIHALERAGDMNAERLWQLPMYDEYFEDLKSEYADMKNSANDGYGGTIRGAIFLKQFIKPGTPWAHLDIAGVAYGMGHLAYYPKRGASGAYVRTLAQFAADF